MHHRLPHTHHGHGHGPGSAAAPHHLTSSPCAALQQTQAAIAHAAPPNPRLGHSVSVVSVAAAVESFYRSAMNSQINYRLTRTRGPLFPRMHVQLPIRMLYINGFKGLRHVIDSSINPAAYGPAAAPFVRLAMACAPGVIMTPISSVLEACNANLNPEPLHIRSIRGVAARCCREVIFGVGLNQLSDHFQRRMPGSLPSGLQNALGSMSAGVVAAFFSHIPHNLSTLKLMHPHKTYLQHFMEVSKPWEARLLSWMPNSPQMATRLAPLCAIVAPIGLGVRTLQIVGSFVVLNGIIHMLTSITSKESSSELATSQPALVAGGAALAAADE